jgi:hypothetical protein
MGKREEGGGIEESMRGVRKDSVAKKRERKGERRERKLHQVQK